MMKFSSRRAQALGAGLTSFAIAGFGSLLMLAPAANAEPVPANIQSQVTTEEQCEWRIFNVPTDFSLEPEDNDSYVGERLTLSREFSGNQDLNVYVTGAEQEAVSESANTACTFYSNVSPGYKTRPTVVIAAAGQFDATYPFTVDGNSTDTADLGMSFSLSTSALKLDVDASTDKCADSDSGETRIWSSPAAGSTELAAGESGTVLEIVDYGDISNTHDVDQGLRCQAPMTVSIVIPADLLPDAPGKTYTWSGISMTTVLTPLSSPN